MIIEYSKRQPDGAITLGDNKWTELPKNIPADMEEFGTWIQDVRSDERIKSVSIDLETGKGTVVTRLPEKLVNRLREEPQGLSIVFPGGSVRLRIDTGTDSPSSEVWFMQHPALPKKDVPKVEKEEKQVKLEDGSEIDMSYKKNPEAERDTKRIHVIRLNEIRKPESERQVLLELDKDEVEEIDSFIHFFRKISASANGMNPGTLYFNKDDYNHPIVYLLPIGIAMKVLDVLKYEELPDEMHEVRKKIAWKNNQAYTKAYRNAKGMK